jgi:hypothetical protein
MTRSVSTRWRSTTRWSWITAWSSARSTPNRRHYEAAAENLARADKGWLGRLITRKVPIEEWHEALERRPGDVKAVISLRE